jgi:hypothetical protein
LLPALAERDMELPLYGSPDVLRIATLPYLHPGNRAATWL